MEQELRIEYYHQQCILILLFNKNYCYKQILFTFAGENLRCEVVNVVDCEFELQSHYYVSPTD